MGLKLVRTLDTTTFWQRHSADGLGGPWKLPLTSTEYVLPLSEQVRVCLRARRKRCVGCWLGKVHTGSGLPCYIIWTGVQGCHGKSLSACKGEARECHQMPHRSTAPCWWLRCCADCCCCCWWWPACPHWFACTQTTPAHMPRLCQVHP